MKPRWALPSSILLLLFTAGVYSQQEPPAAAPKKSAPTSPTGKKSTPPARAAQKPTAESAKGAGEPEKAPDYSEEPFVIEFARTRAQFESDGTGRTVTQIRVKVQSEAGVKQLGELNLGYNAANQKLLVDFVKVHKPDGSVVEAGTDAVKDLSGPVSREAPVYTDFRVKAITVAGLRPGDTLEYQMSLVTETALAPGNFWFEWNFEKNAIVLDESLEVNIPSGSLLKLKTHPGVDPKVEEAGGRRIYRWTASNKVRLSEEEQEKKHKEEKGKKKPEGPAIQMTTFKSWEEVGRWYSALERDRVAPSDTLKARAAELTKDAKTEADKIEALYDFVAKNFRYVSLSFGIGRYQPHSAAEILANQYGDCKDKHTLLAALLATQGIKSQAVLIHSSRKLDEELPSPSQFDHVISYVTAGDQVYWLDTTAEVGPFRMLSGSLRGKKALVVDGPAGGRLETTPADPPFPGFQDVQISGSVSDLGKLTARVQYKVRGDVEMYLRQAFRRVPQQQWKLLAQRIAYSDGFRGEVKDTKAGDPAATREPFWFEYTIEQAGFLDWSNKKSDLDIPLPSAGLPGAGDEEAPDDEKIELGSPLRVTTRLALELPENFKGRAPFGISVARDYASYKSSYKLDGRTLRAERTLEFIQREVPRTRRGDYLAFQRAVRNDEGQALHLESTVTGTPTIPATAKAEELNQTGETALENGNYPVAIQMFQRVVELEPKHKTAWNNLGQAHMALRQFAEAENAFKKQIEIEPFDQYAHNNLGRTYWQQRKYEPAAEAFRKQIEVNPLDRFAHANLGLMLREQKKYPEAVEELEKAVALAPRNALLHASLGQALLNTNQPDRALEAFDKAVELSPTPPVWNNIAYELSLKNIHLDRAQQYAESAVAATAAVLRNISIERLTMNEIGLTASIAAYWDTLGWVYFQRGDMARAEKFVRASWQLALHGEVGDHLGQILEKTGRKEEASRVYAMSLAAERPMEETRGRLEVAGGRQNLDTLVAAGPAALKLVNTHALGAWTEKENARGEFLLLLAPAPASGKIEALKFLRGDERAKRFAAEFTGRDFPAWFPDDTPVKLVRRGEITCSAQSGKCVAVLVEADKVTAVE